MTKDSQSAQYPTDGQGGVTTTASQSLFADASQSRPIIFEAVFCEWNISGAAIFVNIRNANLDDVFSVRVPSTGTLPADRKAQYFPIGGAYGVTMSEPARIRINSSGTSALGGASQVGLIHIFFRYA
jgi:hypothetical protein